MLPLQGARAENPNYTDRFSSINLVNYKNKELYYYDVMNTSVVIITIPAAVEFDGYCFITSPDYITRDPIRWKIEKKIGKKWTIVHEQKTDYNTPRERFATTELFSLIGINAKSIANPLGEIRKKDVAENRNFFYEKGTVPFSPILMDEGIRANPRAARPAGPSAPIGMDTASVVPTRTGHRYIRFRTTATRVPTAEGVQLSSIVFFKDGQQLPMPAGTRVSNPMGVTKSRCTADNVLTPDPHAYWFDLNKQALIFQFPDAIVFDSYAFITAPTAREMDPVRWKLESSHNGTFWQIIDEQSLPFPVPSERMAMTKKIVV